jgi:hypothetical protein
LITEPVDQVVRRIKFSEQHPEWHISYNTWRKVWQAVKSDGDGGTHEVVEYELRPLLDRLERLSA